MPHDKCLHESDWAIVKDHVGDMASDLKTVLIMLRGNGMPGIVTKLALQEQTLKKLHDRLDELNTDLSNISGRAAICEANDVAIKRLWGVVLFIATVIVGTSLKVWYGGA